MGENSSLSVDMKVEMKTLTLSDSSRNKVRETLEYLRGMAFCVKDKSAYKDKGFKLDKQYWVDRGTLEVKGCVNYSELDKNDLTPAEKANKFALSKLQKYGFHQSHCLEALQAVAGDVGRAYEVLMSRYYGVPLPDALVATPPELLEERSLELESLRSIYDDCAQERIANQLWVVNLELTYLQAFLPGALRPKPVSRKPDHDKNICRYFLRGHCKFSNDRCRFKHPVPEKRDSSNDFLDPNKGKFQIEIRFPSGCKYPLDPPIVSFIPLSESFPLYICMRITQRLQEEAMECASKEQPCVYELVTLLKNRPEEIEALCRESPKIYYEPSVMLFPDKKETPKEDEIEEITISIPSLAIEPSNRRSTRNFEKIMREDNELCQKFKTKTKSSTYNRMIERRKELPAWSKQDEILSLIRKNQIIIIAGDTGCGKSTQVGQFILDDWLRNRRDSEHVEIICTQPRRISAIGVADRVAAERDERCGTSVGYQVRLESKTSASTRLLFCTMGILLRRLESDMTLDGVSHLIIDEVHERSEESDFLLLIIKDLLKIRMDLKIILMSATLNPKIFSDYFGNTPMVDIEGRTFPVTQLFLEDIVEMTGYVMEEYCAYSRKINRNCSVAMEAIEELALGDQFTSESIPNPYSRDDVLLPKQLFYRYRDYSFLVKKCVMLTDPERINFELIEHILAWLTTGNHEYPKDGSILVFLPGFGDIKALHDILNDHPYLSPRYGKYQIIPLHSTLTNEEQALVFRKSKPGVRKIILSTNIAETSITIDDCVFVIDTGRQKEKTFDNNRNMESLDTVWVSRANAIQRKGRAGRVMPGVCIHLFTRHRFEKVFRAQPIPEIQRAPLEQIILKIKLLSALAHKDIYLVMDSTIEPPEKDNVSAAIVRLQNVGALESDNTLTPLGHHLAYLPVDVRIGKFILLGTILCCLDSALTIAASLSHKSPFVAPFSKKDELNARRKEFITAHSDHLTILTAYNKWKKASKISRHTGNSFANNNFLSPKILSTLIEMKMHFLELLMDIGFVPADIKLPRRSGPTDILLELTGSDLNVNCGNLNLLSAIMCGALYPNIVKVLTPEKQYAASISGAIPIVSNISDIRFKTKDDGYVQIHPTSVNHNVTQFPHPYLVYQEKVRTSKIFIRECTMVAVLPLVLFSSSNIKVELLSGTFVVSIADGWIMFSVPNNEVAELIQSLKNEFLSLLDEKIKNPSMCLQSCPKGMKIISTIVYLITYG